MENYHVFASTRSLLDPLIEQVSRTAQIPFKTLRLNQFLQYIPGKKCHCSHTLEAPAASKQQDHRDRLIARLLGQTVIVPDLSYIYDGWEVCEHPKVEALREHLEGWFLKWVYT